MTTVGENDVPASKRSEGFPLVHYTHTELTRKNRRQQYYSVDLLQKQLGMSCSHPHGGVHIQYNLVYPCSVGPKVAQNSEIACNFEILQQLNISNHQHKVHVLYFDWN